MQAVFDWDKAMQGQLLAAFYLGYMLMQVPGGLLAARYGPRRVVGAALLLSSACACLAPAAAVMSPWALYGTRVSTEHLQTIYGMRFA